MISIIENSSRDTLKQGNSIIDYLDQIDKKITKWGKFLTLGISHQINNSH